jgi:hypothetical protein
MPDQDFEQNEMDDNPAYYDRMGRRRRAMMSDEEERDLMERGFYGRGSGESPYTSHPPAPGRRTGTGESPYTNYGPRYGYMGRMGESPYTSNPPVNARRYGSGESPYTDYGPAYDPQMQDMVYGEYAGIGPASVTYGEFWLIPGPETGHGPQGYQRSDQRILDDINDRLMLHGRLDARNITTKVEKGEVTLSGTVSSRRAKRMAEDVAESVAGVVDIHDELKVTRPEQPTGQTDQPKT